MSNSNCIGFPRMFQKNTTIVKNDRDAVVQCLSTLLNCESGEFADDPYYGIHLKKYFFDQNDTILRDILVDEMYTQIATFMPQLKLERKDITITQNGIDCTVNIRATNLVNFKTDMYNIKLFSENTQ